MLRTIMVVIFCMSILTGLFALSGCANDRPESLLIKNQHLF